MSRFFFRSLPLSGVVFTIGVFACGTRVDEADRPCPCLAGYACCPTTNECVQEMGKRVVGYDANGQPVHETSYYPSCPALATRKPDTTATDAGSDAPDAAPPRRPPPAKLASAQSARCLTFDAEHVYWQNTNGLVVGAPKGGGTIAVSQFQTPMADSERCGVVVDGALLYATAFALGKVVRQSLSSNGAWSIGASSLAFGAFAGPSSVAVDGEFVYVTELTGGKVTRMAKDGTGDAVVLASGRVRPHGIAVDAQNVYWLDLGDESTKIGAVMTVPKAGGAPKTLAADQLSLGTLAFADEQLFWTRATGEVMRIDFRPPVPGAVPNLAPRVVASGEDRPNGVATDGRHVFFGTASRIREVRISRGAPWSIAHAFDPVVAADGTRVFFTSSGEVWSTGEIGCPPGMTCGGFAGD